ncbi:MAG TPA: MFS transporter [Candidatus Pacearchaeota archaeon]|nr:MFS transporter [Candidatus Pacearchaeota archaeon]
MNKKLALLILSDILIVSSFGLIGPIFALFINQDLAGGVLSAGIATAIYWGVKSPIQLPLSKYLIDKHKRKTQLLLIGTFLIITVPLMYVLAEDVKLIFLAQAVYGFGTALAYPSWFSLFTTYMDKKKKGFEYSLWSTSIGLGSGAAAFFGASIAKALGFRPLFLVVGAIAFAGFLILIALDRVENKKISQGEESIKNKSKVLNFSKIKK